MNRLRICRASGLDCWTGEDLHEDQSQGPVEATDVGSATMNTRGIITGTTTRFGYWDSLLAARRHKH